MIKKMENNGQIVGHFIASAPVSRKNCLLAMGLIYKLFNLMGLFIYVHYNVALQLRGSISRLALPSPDPGVTFTKNILGHVLRQFLKIILRQCHRTYSRRCLKTVLTDL